MHGFYCQSLCSQVLDDHVEANAMTADDDEFGETPRSADQLHRNRRVGSNALDVTVDRNETIGLAERGDRARTLGNRIGSEPTVVSASDKGHHHVFRSPAFGAD